MQMGMGTVVETEAGTVLWLQPLAVRRVREK